MISNCDAHLPKSLAPSLEKRAGVEVEVAVHSKRNSTSGWTFRSPGLGQLPCADPGQGFFARLRETRGGSPGCFG